MSRLPNDREGARLDPESKSLAAHRDMLARAADIAAHGMAEKVPIERQLLALLKNSGLDPADADRLEAEFDKRDRTKARSDLAAHRLAQVEVMSRQGLPIRTIAERLGLSYCYVVELRSRLGVPRSRTRK